MQSWLPCMPRRPSAVRTPLQPPLLLPLPRQALQPLYATEAGRPPVAAEASCSTTALLLLAEASCCEKRLFSHARPARRGPHPPTWHTRASPTYVARKGPAHPHGTQGPRPPHWHAEAGPQPHPHPPASQLGSSLLKRCCRFLAALTHHTPPGLTP